MSDPYRGRLRLDYFSTSTLSLQTFWFSRAIYVQTVVYSSEVGL